MATSTQPDLIPELVDGDRMTSGEFERRYLASPHIRKAELIEGVVYVASPVSLDHCKPHGTVTQWFGYYQLSTPFLICAVEGTVRLDDLNQPQPDVVLFIEPDHGGRATISPDRYIAGAPELVVEISVSSKFFDLNQKFETYRKKLSRNISSGESSTTPSTGSSFAKDATNACHLVRMVSIEARSFQVYGSIPRL